MQKNYLMYVGIIVLIVIIAAVFLAYPANKQHYTSTAQQNANASQPGNLTKIRVGWQNTWATEGQLTQILAHTDFLNKNGLNATFYGFSAGGPLNVAALSGDVDVLFTADTPAASLLSETSNWVIIGRLMYNRVAIYVPPDSPIENVSDLRNKTVAMPFATASQVMAFEAEEHAGLNPLTDVHNINLDIAEQAFIVNSTNASKWGTIDALAGFDPTPAIFQEKGLVRTIYVGKAVSVIMMSKSYIAAHPQAPVEFLKSLYEAYSFYRNNTYLANQWFINASGLNITQAALNLSASIEPNLNGTNSSIRLGFVPSDYLVLQNASNFMYTNNMIESDVNMTDNIDLQYLSEAGLR